MSESEDRQDSNEELEVLIRPEDTVRPLRSFWLTVEIPVFLALFSSALTDGVTLNLLLYRTCIVDLEYNATKCSLLNILNKTGEAKDLETVVQSETTFLVMTLSVFSSIMPAILSVFLGSWSDKYGRKALIVWPLFGQLLTAVLTVVFSAISTLSAYYFVLCALPFAMLGGSSAILLGANLIVTDVTTEDNRSFRLALLQGSGFAGVLVGTVASSYVYDAVGYVPLFTFSTTIYLLTFFYTIIFVRETVETAERGGLLRIFKCALLKDMGRACFKKRSILVASILTLLIASYGITTVCIIGIGTVDYLFTRQKFQWLLKEYSIFSAVNTIVALLGMFWQKFK
ncbi:probable peptidoglycan muropeptide transporter SLC46 [Choristoneura fumiferana]|uniref:probable peptidoglycan muropeptide transporter SLC46 n=1 Tax=Choristoneura fumiferana TaxID=7141 RepID=UPI003D15E60C